MTMIDYKHLKAIIVLCILWPVHGKRKPTWRINSILGDVGLRDVRFGYSVAIDGDSIIVGEPGWPGIVAVGEQPLRTGSVSFYRKTTRSKVTQPPWVLQNRINTTNVITQDGAQLGLVVAIAGDYAAATAMTDSSSLATTFAEVHIFHRNATKFWNFDFKIAQPGGDVANSGFGQSLAMTQDLIVIGAINNVYLFERTGDTWAQITFTIPVLPATALFGASVALDVNATLIAVGAPGEINGANSLKTGAVYLFEFGVRRRRLSGTDAVARQLPPAASGWLNSAILFASDSANFDQFGLAVAVNKKRVLVGAPGFDFYGTNSGSAYVFNLTAGVWTQEQKLMPLLASGDVFGGSVTIDNGAKDILVVGADHVDTFGDDGGVIFVYEYNARTFQWIPTERSRFHAGGNEFLGVSVDIANGVVVAGAWGVDGKGDNTDKGNAFVYAKQKCPFLLPMRCQKNGF